MGTNWTEITTFEQIITSANAHGPFWTAMLYMLWIVLVITFLPFGSSVAIIGGGFLAFFIGIFLAYMGFVSWKYLMIILGTVILMILWEALFSRKDQ